MDGTSVSSVRQSYLYPELPYTLDARATIPVYGYTMGIPARDVSAVSPPCYNTQNFFEFSKPF